MLVMLKGCFICELFADFSIPHKCVDPFVEEGTASGRLRVVSLGKGLSASRFALKVGVFIQESFSDLCLCGVGVHVSGCLGLFCEHPRAFFSSANCTS